MVYSMTLVSLEIVLLNIMSTTIAFLINILIVLAILYIEKDLLIKIFGIIVNTKQKVVKKYKENRRINFDSNNKKRLRNTDFSIICSNCIAGVIYHNLGLQFKTPTINLYFEAKDFVKFCSDLKGYLSMELEEVKTNSNYPVARLGDIKLYGVHYKNYIEMKNKWNERKKRINYNNLFFIMTERDGCTYDDIVSFSKINYPHKIIFTHKKYEEIPDSVFIKGTNNKDNYHKTRPLTDYKSKLSSFRFIDDFDYVEWLNNK